MLAEVVVGLQRFIGRDCLPDLVAVVGGIAQGVLHVFRTQSRIGLQDCWGLQPLTTTFVTPKLGNERTTIIAS
jgi:hypothetical protein